MLQPSYQHSLVTMLIASWITSMALLLSIPTVAISGASCQYADCVAYCNGTCPFRPNISTAGTESLRVWRITPWNVTDLPNHDTGDAAGDMGFLLEKYMSGSQCKPPYNTHECFLDDKPIVAQFDVTFDGAYGPYLKCNPTPQLNGLVDTGHFQCGYGYPNNSLWEPGKKGFTCPLPCNRANISVGKDPAHHIWNGTRQAADGLTSYFGGFWYSTTAEGECVGSHSPGDGSGCTWKVTNTPKYINASCLADQLFAVLKKTNPGCFQSCGPNAGRGNSCFARCVEETVIGVPAGTGKGVEISSMEDAWETAFTSACPLINPAKLVSWPQWN